MNSNFSRTEMNYRNANKSNREIKRHNAIHDSDEIISTEM